MEELVGQHALLLFALYLLIKKPFLQEAPQIQILLYQELAQILEERLFDVTAGRRAPRDNRLLPFFYKVILYRDLHLLHDALRDGKKIYLS